MKTKTSCLKSRTIDSLCAVLKELAAPNLPQQIQQDLAKAILLIQSGHGQTALEDLVQVRIKSAMADENNTAYIAATEEIAAWMIHRATTLIILSEVNECLGCLAREGKLRDIIRERERFLRQMAS